MKIAILGAGAMGGALAKGLLKGSIFKPEDIVIANPHRGKLEEFDLRGMQTTTDNCIAVDGAQLIDIVVKTWLVEQVINEIKPVLNYQQQIIINIAAGISSNTLFTWLDKDGTKPALFQVIPNIAIAYRDDMGQSLITDEEHLAAGTTLASCGIAYAMRYVRAAAEGGVELGFKADTATAIVLQTLQGAVSFLQGTGLHPEAAIDQVTTPKGLTIKGLNAMEHAGFTNAVIEGLKAGIK